MAVKSRLSWDCGVAALAQATGHNYIKVFNWFHGRMKGYQRPEGYGVSPEEMSQYLFLEAGVRHHVIDLDTNEAAVDGLASLRQHDFDLWREAHRPCLVAVSKEGEGGHWLYFDGNEFHDPHPQNAYSDAEELLNHFAILLEH